MVQQTIETQFKWQPMKVVTLLVSNVYTFDKVEQWAVGLGFTTK
jgi:hypothetical protein